MIRSRPALLSAIAAAALLPAAGCGGDDEPVVTAPVETAPETVVDTAPESVPTHPAFDEEADERPDAEAEREARREARARRAATARRAARAMAIAMDLETAAIKTETGGTVLTVVLEHQNACRMDEEDMRAFRRGVRAAAPRAERIRLRGQGETAKQRPLDAYQEQSCVLRSRPAAKIVLDQSGRGDRLIRGIRMSARRWQIEYTTSADRFRLSVIDDRDRTVLTARKPRSGLGERVVSGSGRYAIRISSTGKWTLRLRDGA